MSLRRYVSLKGSPLKRHKGLDRGSKIRSRSKSKRAVTKAGLWRELSEWVRAEGVCFYCGREVGPENLDAHHLITRGADASLKLHPAIAVPACNVPNWPDPSCHDRAKSLDWLVEQRKPGLLAHLRYLGRTVWFKRDLDVVEADIREAKKRPWREFWDALEVA